jgi:Sap, sulfolipid-1-addressing protein
MRLLIPILLLGVLASLSPITLVVFILLLFTTRARLNAVAFLVGWGISLSVVFATSYAIGSSLAGNHGADTMVDIVEIVLGAGLVCVGAVEWRRRDRPPHTSPRTKALTSRLRHLHPWQAALVGVLKQPWALTAVAAVLVVRHYSGALDAFFAFLVFTVASTATIAGIFVYYSREPGQAEAVLDVLRDRLERSQHLVGAVVAFAVGVFLVVDGMLGLL